MTPEQTQQLKSMSADKLIDLANLAAFFEGISPRDVSAACMAELGRRAAARRAA